MNVLVEKVLSGSSMGSLIQQPRGHVENNMMFMTGLVIAATYLDKTKQWDTVGFSKRDIALEYIKRGIAIYTHTSFGCLMCSEGSLKCFSSIGNQGLCVTVIRVPKCACPSEG